LKKLSSLPDQPHNLAKPSAGEPVLIPHTIVVEPSRAEVKVILPARESGLGNISTYASAIPGTIVAVAGFAIVHFLTKRRERENRVVKLYDGLREQAEKAATTAISAWMWDAGASRVELVHQTKREIQALGISATRLEKASRTVGRRGSLRDCWNARSLWPLFSKRLINVRPSLVRLRQAATHDPFEDPDRAGETEPAKNIQIALANFTHSLDEQFRRCLG